MTLTGRVSVTAAALLTVIAVFAQTHSARGQAAPPPPNIFSPTPIDLTVAKITADMFTHNIPQRMERLQVGWGLREPFPYGQSAKTSDGSTASIVTTRSFLPGRRSVGPDGTTSQIRLGEWAAWVAATGRWGGVRNDGAGRPGYSFTTWGVLVGVDYRSHDWIIGFHGGYANSDGDQNGDTSDADVQVGFGGVHGSIRWWNDFWGAMYFDGTVSIGYARFDTSQDLSIFGGNGSLPMGYEGTVFATYLEVGTVRRYGRIGVQPFVAMRIIVIDADSHSGSATGLAVNVSESTYATVRPHIGLRALYEWEVGGVLMAFKGRVAYAAEVAEVKSKAFFTVNGRTAGLVSARNDQHMVVGGATIFASLSPQVQLLLDFQGVYGERTYLHSVWGGFRFRW